MSMDIILKFLGPITGITGTVLSLYNLISARRKEKLARQHEGEDMEKWFLLVKQAQGNPAPLIWQFTVGSVEHRWAERMVARGLLKRGFRASDYMLPRDF